MDTEPGRSFEGRQTDPDLACPTPSELIGKPYGYIFKVKNGKNRPKYNPTIPSNDPNDPNETSRLLAIDLTSKSRFLTLGKYKKVPPEDNNTAVIYKTSKRKRFVGTIPKERITLLKKVDNQNQIYPDGRVYAFINS